MSFAIKNLNQANLQTSNYDLVKINKNTSLRPRLYLAKTCQEFEDKAPSLWTIFVLFDEFLKKIFDETHQNCVKKATSNH